MILSGMPESPHRCDVHHRRRMSRARRGRAVHEVLYDDVLETLQAREVELVVVALDEVVKRAKSAACRSSTVRADPQRARACAMFLPVSSDSFSVRDMERFQRYGRVRQVANGIGRRAAMRHRMGLWTMNRKHTPAWGGVMIVSLGGAQTIANSAGDTFHLKAVLPASSLLVNYGRYPTP